MSPELAIERDPIWPTYIGVVVAVIYYIVVMALGEPVIEHYIVAFIIAMAGAVVSLCWILRRTIKRRTKL